MDGNIQNLLVFVVEKQRFAIQLSQIERVIRAVAITNIKNSPGFIDGVIDFYGEVIAVIDLRLRLGYAQRELRITDRFIIVRTNHRKLALIVDEVEDILLPDAQDWYDSKDINKGLKFLNIVREDGGIIFIYDIKGLLDTDEEIQLNRFLKTNFPSTIVEDE